MSPAKHEHVATVLRARILGDVFGEQGKLPSEAALIQEFGVSRTTIRSALSALTGEGLVRSETGVGTFVRTRRRHVYRPQADLGRPVENPEADHFLRSEAEHDPSQAIRVGLEPAPEVVATRLGVQTGEFVAVRSRIRYFGGVPYQINDSYYPREIVEGTDILLPVDIARGANTVLAELGHEQVRCRDEIYIQMPTPDEVSRLDILPGTPVAVHLVSGFDAADRVVRVVRNVLPGDRHIITFDRTRPDDDA
ncbi:GntR family transcriptional regulator [Pseudonocardia kongjuensis]|uniref:GntR family transcriptional regulator n=1 Tax=Pseudonocardia kongjuensis TaxID=102227 RepID=A0ABN1XKF3_9PSEU